MGCFGFGRKSPTIGDDDVSVENSSTNLKRPGSSSGSSGRPLRTQSSLGPRGAKGGKSDIPGKGALSRATSAPAISTSSQTFLLSGNGSVPQSPSTPSARAPPPLSPSAASQAVHMGSAATAALMRSTSAADASSPAVSSPTGSMARGRNGGSSSMSRIAMLQQRQQQQQITNLHPLPPPVGEALMKAADDDRLASPGSGKAKATSPTSVCTNSHLSASSSSVSSASTSSPPISSATAAGGSGRDPTAAPRNTFGPTGSSSTGPSCPSSGGSVVGPLGDERSGAGAIAASADAAAATAAAAAAGTSASGTTGLSIQAFSLAFLEEITSGFSAERLLGEGGFGPVFLGMMPKSALAGSAAAGEGKAKGKGKKWTDRVKGQTGFTSSPSKKEDVVPVAIKALRSGGHQGEREFLAEVQYLGHLSHPHLVNLLGYCADGPERLLVYEFMANGSLEFKLFDHDEEEKTEEDGSRRQPLLTWHQRIQVAIGAAKGLAYLHEGAEHQVIYRDFKTSNILLDTDMNAKLADFGLARSGPDGEKSHVSTRIVGTIGYAAPEYVLTGHLTAKSDVWAFGVVLLELLTGRLALDKSRPREEQSLVEWAEPFLGNPQRLYRIMDPNLNGMYSVRGAQMAAAVAHKCLNKRPKQRPKMSEVVAALEPVLAFHDTVGVLSRQVGSQSSGLPAGGALTVERPAAAAAAGGSRRA